MDRCTHPAELVGPPPECFTSPLWHERDLAVIFRTRWQLAGHASELPVPGDFMRFRSGPDEALIMRGRDGEVHSYRNFCRHRGHRLCDLDSGRVGGRIVCPYHGWSYSLDDGSLVRAPKMHDGFDRRPWGLHRPWLDQYRGLLFIAFGEARPAPVAELLDTWGAANGEADALAGYDFGRMKVAARSDWDVEANWKLAVENNLECYHCKLNHPELCRVMDPWGLPGRYGSDGGVPTTREIDAVGAQEVRRSGEFDTRYSFDGETLCATPLPRLDERQGPSFFMHITPYNVIAPAGDYVWTWAIDPIGPAHSRVRHMFLVHEEARAGVDYDPETLPRFWDTVMSQDEPLCRELQRGISQPTYTPGPLNRLHQLFVAGFYRWYEQAMRAAGHDTTTSSHLLGQRAQHDLVDGHALGLLEREDDRAGHVRG